MTLTRHRPPAASTRRRRSPTSSRRAWPVIMNLEAAEREVVPPAGSTSPAAVLRPERQHGEGRDRRLPAKPWPFTLHDYEAVWPFMAIGAPTASLVGSPSWVERTCVYGPMELSPQRCRQPPSRRPRRGYDPDEVRVPRGGRVSLEAAQQQATAMEAGPGRGGSAAGDVAGRRRHRSRSASLVEPDEGRDDQPTLLLAQRTADDRSPPRKERRRWVGRAQAEGRGSARRGESRLLTAAPRPDEGAGAGRERGAGAARPATS